MKLHRARSGLCLSVTETSRERRVGSTRACVRSVRAVTFTIGTFPRACGKRSRTSINTSGIRAILPIAITEPSLPPRMNIATDRAIGRSPKVVIARYLPISSAIRQLSRSRLDFTDRGESR